MPTPFTHLAAVAEILDHAELATGTRAALLAELPAFLFGNTAPDVQTISGQPREATHFFSVPLRDTSFAGRHMLARHAVLAARSQLPAGQAAFIAGYLAHLVYDQLWIREVFEPFFGEAAAWGDWRERLYLHNVLRAHMDADDLQRMEPAVAGRLRAATPSQWLPFEADRHLSAWRDLLTDQLSSGAGRTVEVFAQRMRVDPREFSALLASPEQMEQRVWAHVPPSALADYRADARTRSVRVIGAYWQGADLPSQ